MYPEESLVPSGLDDQEGTGTERDDETTDFNRLVHLADETGLLRLGVNVLERVAHAEGRILWH